MDGFSSLMMSIAKCKNTQLEASSRLNNKPINKIDSMVSASNGKLEECMQGNGMPNQSSICML
jgi:hypothetical protein